MKMVIDRQVQIVILFILDGFLKYDDASKIKFKKRHKSQQSVY